MALNMIVECTRAQAIKGYRIVDRSICTQIMAELRKFATTHSVQTDCVKCTEHAFANTQLLVLQEGTSESCIN